MQKVCSTPLLYISSVGHADDLQAFARCGVGALITCGVHPFYGTLLNAASSEDTSASTVVATATRSGLATLIIGDLPACGEFAARHLISEGQTLREALSAILAIPTALPTVAGLTRLAELDLNTHGRISLHNASDMTPHKLAIEEEEEEVMSERGDLFARMAGLREMFASASAKDLVDAVHNGMVRAEETAVARDVCGTLCASYVGAVRLGLAFALGEASGVTLATELIVKCGGVRGEEEEEGEERDSNNASKSTLLTVCGCLVGNASVAFTQHLESWCRQTLSTTSGHENVSAFIAHTASLPHLASLKHLAEPFAEGGTVFLPKAHWGAHIDTTTYALPAILKEKAEELCEGYGTTHGGRVVQVCPALGRVEVRWMWGPRKSVILVVSTPATVLLDAFQEKDAVPLRDLQDRLPVHLFATALRSLTARTHNSPILIVKCETEKTVHINTSFRSNRHTLDLTNGTAGW